MKTKAKRTRLLSATAGAVRKKKYREAEKTWRKKRRELTRHRDNHARTGVNASLQKEGTLEREGNARKEIMVRT